MKYRSNETELMDDLHLPTEALTGALNDIAKVNRLLGGNKITLDAVYKLLQKYPQQKHFTLIDVGCGDGTQLREIAVYLKKRKVSCSLIGIDINEKSLEMGRNLSTSFPEISFRNQDILTLNKEALQCDLILTTFTMHHFTDQEILVFMKKFFDLCNLGIIVNDLHRDQLAYKLFKVFSFLFFKSPIAKNDGLVSIQRGFKRAELQQFSKKLHFTNYRISWKWAFRYVWIISKNDSITLSD